MPVPRAEKDRLTENQKKLSFEPEDVSQRREQVRRTRSGSAHLPHRQAPQRQLLA